MTIAKAIWMSLTSDVVSYRGWNTWRCSAFFHFKHTSKPRPSEATLKSSKEAVLEGRTQLGFLGSSSVDQFVLFHIEQEL